MRDRELIITRRSTKIIHPSRIYRTRKTGFWGRLFGLNEVIVRGCGDINEPITDEQALQFLSENGYEKVTKSCSEV